MNLTGLNKRFDHEIREVVEYENCYIVLLSVPFDENMVNNIFCLDDQLNIKWRAEDLDKKYPEKNNLPYEQMTLRKGVIKATDFYGRCYLLNVSNGKIIDMTIVK